MAKTLITRLFPALGFSVAMLGGVTPPASGHVVEIESHVLKGLDRWQRTVPGGPSVMAIPLSSRRMEWSPWPIGESHPPLPVDRRVTSPFGLRPSRRTGEATFHAGIDFEAPKGTPAYAVRWGIVERVLRNGERRNRFQGYGNAVVIYHPDDDRWSFYAHLDGTTVAPGSVVQPGDQVGTVGATSNRRFRGMGVHLHFEVRERTRSGDAPFPGPYRVNNIDPRLWLAAHGLQYTRRGHLVTAEAYESAEEHSHYPEG